MGAAQARASTGGTFRPIGYQQPGRRVRTDEEIDLQSLSDEEQEVVEAEQFIVYGRANIEQWNEPGPGEDNLYIEMDALEEKIDQLLAIENISFAHQDVRVGEPLESYTFETDSVIHLDKDESLEFDPGDTIQTEVIREGEPLPDGSGPAGEDSLWLCANIFGRDDPRGSRFSQKVRLGAYYGELDGFSVTIDKLEMTPTAEGVRTHEVDFLAVTIGTDDLIKNPGSSFGVAEFQALFGAVPHDASRELLAEDSVQGNTIEHQLMGSILDSLRRSSTDQLASEAIQQAHDDSIELQAAVEDLVDGDHEDVLQQAEEKLNTLEEQVKTIAEEADADSLEDAAAELADEAGLDKEFIMEMVDQAKDMDDDMEDYEDEEDEPPEDEEDEDDVTVEVESRLSDLEEQFNQLEEQLPDGDLATAEEVQSMVSEALDGVASADELESQLSDLGETISDNLGDFVEQQMETAATPGPTGGGIAEADVEQQMEEWADEITPDAEPAGGD